jgi:nicotinic acid mononucleotide adenylyltransferase
VTLSLQTGARGVGLKVTVVLANRFARYAVDERELRPDASGFTFDSLSSLHKDVPDKSFILLLGADQYAKRLVLSRGR